MTIYGPPPIEYHRIARKLKESEPTHNPRYPFPVSPMPTTTQKPSLLGMAPSFGFGDRLGLATPGHLDALASEGGPIKGIFAQQSIREMTRTKRSPQQVMADAARTLEQEGFNDVWGADADHLKTPQDVDATAAAGFVFFTIDPSDHVDGQADTYDGPALEQKFAAVRPDAAWFEHYCGRTVQVPDGPKIAFEPHTVMRAAVKYGRALAHALELGAYIRAAADRLGQPHEIELSVDETPQPTTLAEHYIIAEQCREAKMNLVSLAPRFVGDFEKGVDFKGSVEELADSLAQHAAIARDLGPYKLSVHSGSDKLSMYAPVARATRGLFHVKTAGTSYLEALRVVARHDEALFRRIVDFARRRYDQDKATYHVSGTVAGEPPSDQIADVRDLERIYLGSWAQLDAVGDGEGRGFTNGGRQILHCTFGSVLTDPDLGSKLRQLLESEPATHRQVLAEHFERHLRALRRGL